MYFINDNDIAEFHNLYKRAEEAIKVVENIDKDEGLPISLINELRYAGRHLIDSLYSNDQVIATNNFSEAKIHARRAFCDAKEITMIFLLKQIMNFMEDYKDSPITDVVPDFVDRMKRIKKAQKFLQVINRDKIITDLAYTTVMDDFIQDLEETNNTLDLARPELDKELKKYFWEFSIIAGTLILTFVGVIIAIIKY
jgi:hypothetical protein